MPIFPAHISAMQHGICVGVIEAVGIRGMVGGIANHDAVNGFFSQLLLSLLTYGYMANMAPFHKVTMEMWRLVVPEFIR